MACEDPQDRERGTKRRSPHRRRWAQKSASKSGFSFRRFTKKADATDNSRIRLSELSREVLERIIPQGVVGKDESSRTHKRMSSLKFPYHVLVGVQTIGKEGRASPEARKQRGKNLPGVPDRRPPSFAQPVGNEPPRFVARRQKGGIIEANGVRAAATAVFVQGKK